MFRFRNLSIAAFLLAAPFAQASTVAIIDSGTDITHPDLIGKVWKNAGETLNKKDDDGNGFVDDINGWNFFANSNELIDLKYETLLSNDIQEFFVIQEKLLLGTASADDLEWIKAKAADAAFVSSINKYGTFVHGTHVAGIASQGNDDARVMTIRLVPVENPLLQFEQKLIEARQNRDLGFIAKGLIKLALSGLASAQGTAFGLVGEYANSSRADVANASLGVGALQAQLIVKPLVGAAGGDVNDMTLINELSLHFLNKAVEAQKKIATSATSTLFVFASGNDGTDNDAFPVSPANAGLENTMSVGASIGYQSIAPFSNYGKKTVDVLAPGVGIISSVPGGGHMALSGTSQAAPFVAGVAAGVKDANPALTPAQIKAIIIGTVDVKADLKNKVASSGIVNRERALAAAELSLGTTVASAIADARVNVADHVVTQTFLNADLIAPTPVGSPIVATPDLQDIN